jgi:hypothetical protein
LERVVVDPHSSWDARNERHKLASGCHSHAAVPHCLEPRWLQQTGGIQPAMKSLMATNALHLQLVNQCAL